MKKNSKKILFIVLLVFAIGAVVIYSNSNVKTMTIARKMGTSGIRLTPEIYNDKIINKFEGYIRDNIVDFEGTEWIFDTADITLTILGKNNNYMLQIWNEPQSSQLVIRTKDGEKRCNISQEAFKTILLELNNLEEYKRILID